MTAVVAAWISDAVQQFGTNLGIDNCRPNERGGLQLSLQSGGLLAVEPVQRGDHCEVLVFASRPTGYHAAAMLKAGLTKAFESPQGPYPVQVALLGNGPEATVLALVRLAERDFTLPVLEKSVEFLQRWLAELPAA